MSDIPCKREDLTKEWLQSLFDSQNEEIIIDEVILESGSKKGDNFSAEIVKATIKGKKHGEPHSLSVFVKMASADGSVGNKTLDVPIFPTEVEAYSKVFPDMMAAQHQAEKIPLPIAKCYLAARRELSGIIVMEDLKANGFKLANFFEGQTLDEVRLVMRKMAVLHASGYNLKFQKKEQMKDLYPQLFSNSWWVNRNKMENMIKQGVKAAGALIEGIEGYEGKGKRIQDKAEYLSTHAMEGMRMQPDHPLSTVCQGDIWSNNMLFKYNQTTGKAEEVRLLDFELLSFYPPIIDLLYYLYSSTLPQFRKKHLKDMLQLYHAELSTNLQCFGVTENLLKDLTVDWLWDEFHSDRSLFGMSIALTFIPMVLSLAENAIDYENKDALDSLGDAFKAVQSKDPRNHPFVMDRINGSIEELERLRWI